MKPICPKCYGSLVVTNADCDPYLKQMVITLYCTICGFQYKFGVTLEALASTLEDDEQED